MLQKLRNLTNTIFVKIIICLLILSFVLWGIGDLFRSKLTSRVAKIGNISISQEYLDYRTKLLKERYAEYLGDTASSDPSLMQNLALNNIIRDKIIELESNELGYKINNKLAFSLIKNNINFLDIDGKFSKIKLENYLLQSNITEAILFKNLSKEIVTEIFNNSLNNDSIAFPKLYKLERDFINQQRTISLITVKIPKIIPEITNPTESELLDFYSKHKEDYILPETSDFQIISFHCKNFENKVTVTNLDAKQEFETNTDKYHIPEQRQIQQLFSKSQEKINKAHKDLENGKDFTKIAQNLNMEEEKINLGFQVRKKLYSGFVEQIFNLNTGQYTTPIKGPFGWHIFKLLTIKKGQQVSFTTVKQKIIQSLTEQKSCNLATEYFNKAENDIAAQLSLQDIATNYKLSIQNFDKVKAGNAPHIDGLNQIQSQKLHKIILSEKETNIIKSKIFDKHLFILYNLKQINDQRYLTIDEIKGVLDTRWKTNKHQIQYQDIAKKIHSELKENDGRTDISNKLKQEYNFSLSNITLTRDSDILPIEFTEQIFKLAQDNISEVFFDQENNQYLLAKLLHLKTKQLSPGKQMLMDENIKNNYLQYFNNNINNAYINYLMKKYKVELKTDI